jgi:8-oxo-dGTP diphosphatase
VSRSLVPVAVGVLTRGDGTVLLGRRPPGKVYAGYWEFPGGKIEPGETALQALQRELHEELGIDDLRATPWFARTFSYPHAEVRLRFFRVSAWTGEPRAKEHDGLAWQAPSAFTVAPMLPANTPILRALVLPQEYALSDATRMGVPAFLAALEGRLASGLRLVQLREKTMSPGELSLLAAQVRERCDRYGARLLLNGEPAVAAALGADGVHLSAQRLAAISARPPLEWVGASCHTAQELARAAALGMDFAVLGPVQATPTHPGVHPLGWSGFAALVAEAELPVFAIGGLDPGDLEQAAASGAHGLAMIRGAWTYRGQSLVDSSSDRCDGSVAPRSGMR